MKPTLYRSPYFLCFLTLLFSCFFVLGGCKDKSSDCMTKCESYNGDEFKACMKGCAGVSANKSVPTKKTANIRKPSATGIDSNSSIKETKILRQEKEGEADDPIVQATEKYELETDTLRFQACYEMLSHIKMGLESYMSENGDISDVGPDGEVLCSHLFYDPPGVCEEKMASRVNDVCSGYKIVPIDGYKYNIIGKAKDRKHCCIVITEVMGNPQKYSDCSSKCPNPVR